MNTSQVYRSNKSYGWYAMNVFVAASVDRSERTVEMPPLVKDNINTFLISVVINTRGVEEIGGNKIKLIPWSVCKIVPKVV